jgi:hypothetical protein
VPTRSAFRFRLYGAEPLGAVLHCNRLLVFARYFSLIARAASSDYQQDETSRANE